MSTVLESPNPPLEKPHYLEVLRNLHSHLRPRTYLEIGVDKGNSLCLALDTSLKVGIDPSPSVEVDIGDAQVFTMTSDAFFGMQDVRAIFQRLPVDFSFIDGLHLFEATLRDFFNVQKYCTTDSVIAVHDCYAWDEATSTRERMTDFWTGDVWRFVPALQQLQPGLELRTIDVAPTGLCLITKLDPEFVLDEREFDAVVDRYMNERLPATPEGRAQVCLLVDYDWAEIVRRLPARV